MQDDPSLAGPSQDLAHRLSIELSAADARFLRQQLTRHLEEMERELVHTDSREMQREIAADARRLRDLIERILGAPEPGAG